MSNIKNISDFSETSSPKRNRRKEPEEAFADLIVRLPSLDPEDKGPKINYTDGLTNEHIELLRKESTNRINAK